MEKSPNGKDPLTIFAGKLQDGKATYGKAT